MITKRTVFVGIFFMTLPVAGYAATENASSHVVQIAQASTVTKFRGLFVGMTMGELDQAFPQLGLTKEPFTDVFTKKVDPTKFNLKRGSETAAFLYFDDQGRLEGMNLEHTFFDIPAPIPMREFAERLVKAYNMTGMRYERHSNILGSFWAYRGETNTGERLMVVDYTGAHSPTVEITRARTGSF